MPWLTPKHMLISQDNLVRGDADVKAILSVPAFALLFPLFLTAVVRQDFEARQEFLELHFPVEHLPVCLSHDHGRVEDTYDTGRYDNEMRAPHAFFACEPSQKRNGLQCFA